MEIKTSIFCIVLLLFFTISRIAADEKTLKLVLDQLIIVKSDDNILNVDIKIDKEGENEAKINGQVEQFIDIDDDYKVNIDVLHSPEKDGEYKKRFTSGVLGVCTVMSKFYKKYFYDSLKNYSNAPDPDMCPLTPETYIIKDYPLDSSKFSKMLLPGFYNITVSIIHNEEEVLKYYIEGHTIKE